MRIAGLFALAVLFPVFAHAAVVINEIAWMGTDASSNAEWIELANTGNTSINLTNWTLTISTSSSPITILAKDGSTSIDANGYYLLERTSDATVPDIAADQIYTGALSNNGTTLILKDAAGSAVDTVDGSNGWKIGGGEVKGKNTTPKETAQRIASGWETAAATPRAINAGVSDSTPPDTPTDSTVTTTQTSSGGVAEYLPIPTLRIVTGGDRTVSSGADTAFTAVVYDSKGNRRDDSLVTWSFGDGMRKTGASVYHEYYNPGEYLAVVHATTSDGGDALVESVVMVKDASIKISSISSRGIALSNNDSRTLDLSLWRLSMGGQEFKIPADTQILAGHTVLFPSQVIELPTADAAFLLYPSGEVAAVYPQTMKDLGGLSYTQPSNNVVSYKQVSEVEPALSARAGTPVHEEAVIAPAAATELAAVGAASISPPPKAKGFFSSPWTFGLLGVIALAGTAFIFL